jgi:hypothetical protein
MRSLGIFAGIIGFLCLVMGLLVLLGALPEEMLTSVPEELTWNVWFWLSGLLLLINIACVAGGGGRRGGGGGEEF